MSARRSGWRRWMRSCCTTAADRGHNAASPGVHRHCVHHAPRPSRGSLQATRGPSHLPLSMGTDHPDGSLPAQRRGTLSGMDAAPEPTRTYLRHVPRRWAGKGLAAEPQTACPASSRRCALSAWTCHRCADGNREAARAYVAVIVVTLSAALRPTILNHTPQKWHGDAAFCGQRFAIQTIQQGHQPRQFALAVGQ